MDSTHPSASSSYPALLIHPCSHVAMSFPPSLAPRLPHRSRFVSCSTSSSSSRPLPLLSLPRSSHDLCVFFFQETLLLIFATRFALASARNRSRILQWTARHAATSSTERWLIFSSSVTSPHLSYVRRGEAYPLRSRVL
jgi:hypothetical protein